MPGRAVYNTSVYNAALYNDGRGSAASAARPRQVDTAGLGQRSRVQLDPVLMARPSAAAMRSLMNTQHGLDRRARE
jgi:hypothetical protein